MKTKQAPKTTGHWPSLYTAGTIISLGLTYIASLIMKNLSLLDSAPADVLTNLLMLTVGVFAIGAVSTVYFALADHKQLTSKSK